MLLDYCTWRRGGSTVPLAGGFGRVYVFSDERNLKMPSPNTENGHFISECPTWKPRKNNYRTLYPIVLAYSITRRVVRRVCGDGTCGRTVLPARYSGDDFFLLLFGLLSSVSPGVVENYIDGDCYLRQRGRSLCVRADPIRRDFFPTHFPSTQTTRPSHGPTVVFFRAHKNQDISKSFRTLD